MGINLICFEIHGDPQGKGRPVAGKSFGGRLTLRTPSKTRAYEQQVAWAGKQAMAGRAPMDGLLWANITAFMPVPASWSKKERAAALEGMGYAKGRIDADNIAKAVLDGLNGIAYADDVQVVDLRSVKRYTKLLPRVVVSIGLADGVALCQNDAQEVPHV